MKRLALVASILVACAAPAAQQGTAGQGGSTGPTPAVVIYIGSDHGTVTVTSAPTAAPAAASTATATQPSTATVTPSANLGDSAIKAVVPSVPLPAVVPATKP